jgi:Spy/CpxP family protein refolding chaperone
LQSLDEVLTSPLTRRHLKDVETTRLTNGCSAFTKTDKRRDKMKFNWKKSTLIVAIAGALMLTAAAAVAVAFSHGHRSWQGRQQGEGLRRGPGPRDGLGPLVRDLNLTDDQKTQIKKITDSSEESNKALFDQLRTLHQNEPDPLSGNFDEAAVRAAAEARAKVQVELEVSRAKMMSQIGGILTAEQKAQVAAKRQHERQRTQSER